MRLFYGSHLEWTLDALWQSPVNKGPKQQSDGLLNVLSAQPAPLPLHQQAQDVESHVSQRSFIWRSSYNLRDKKVLIERFSWQAPETQKVRIWEQTPWIVSNKSVGVVPSVPHTLLKTAIMWLEQDCAASFQSEFHSTIHFKLPTLQGNKKPRRHNTWDCNTSTYYH